MQNKLEICKNCKKSKRDFKLGLICGVTGKKPDFEENCKLFEPTEFYLAKKEIELEHAEADKPIITTTKEWKCSNCNEINEDNYDVCWNCQTERSTESEVVEETFIGKSKNEQNEQKEFRYAIEGFLVVFWGLALLVLIKAYFAWSLNLFVIEVLPDKPESMFIFLILYNVLYIINYKTFTKKEKEINSLSLFRTGIIINIILVGFYLVGKAIT